MRKTLFLTALIFLAFVNVINASAQEEKSAIFNRICDEILAANEVFFLGLQLNDSNTDQQLLIDLYGKEKITNVLDRLYFINISPSENCYLIVDTTGFFQEPIEKVYKGYMFKMVTDYNTLTDEEKNSTIILWKVQKNLLDEKIIFSFTNFNKHNLYRRDVSYKNGVRSTQYYYPLLKEPRIKEIAWTINLNDSRYNRASLLYEHFINCSALRKIFLDDSVLNYFQLPIKDTEYILLTEEKQHVECDQILLPDNLKFRVVDKESMPDTSLLPNRVLSLFVEYNRHVEGLIDVAILYRQDERAVYIPVNLVDNSFRFSRRGYDHMK